MAKGYWIAMVNITEPDRYGEYMSKTGPALENYNATPLVRGGQNQAVEGDSFERVVVLEFPSYQDAVDCYNSPEYQSAKAIQDGASVRNLTIVEGA